MNNLVMNGIKSIDGVSFHDIEGGFGGNKKALLVKEIANIHEKQFKHINEAINNNRKRFKDNIDIVDLKGTEFAVDLVDSEIYTQNSINASKNIYLLSERGYSKLLKILEDDVAWEQYDKLVDEYFDIRSGRKEKSKFTERESDTRSNNSFARVINSFNKILSNPNISEEATRKVNIKLEQFLACGDITLIKPIGRKVCLAKEIGRTLGISKNKVGRLAKANNLKTEEYGEWFKEKVNGKEVQNFMYYDNIIPVLKKIIGEQEKFNI